MNRCYLIMAATLLFASASLRASEPWFITLDGVAGLPVAPQEYRVGDSQGVQSLYGGEAYVAYRFYQGYSLGLGYNYSALARQAGPLEFSIPELGLQADLPELGSGTPYVRLTGGYNALSDAPNGWSGRYVGQVALGYLLPLSSHVGLDLALGYWAASPQNTVLQAPIIKVGVAFDGFCQKTVAVEAKPSSAASPAGHP